MADEKVSERLMDSPDTAAASAGLPQNGAFLSLNSNSSRPAYKKQESVMVSVYKLIGINPVPTSREIGTLVLLGVWTILFVISVTGFFVMWFTEVYDQTFVSQLILRKNSSATDAWLKPPVNSFLKAHIFNYTNLDRYLTAEDDKIHVKDLGPYTYEQFATKVNVQFNLNHTVTFNDHRSYKFRPDLSQGDPIADRVVVPNVPFLTASVEIDKMTFWKKIVAKPAVSLLDLDPFINLDAYSFLWGYDDPLLDLMRLYSSHNIPDQFGMLTNRNGTSPDTIQIYTGEGSLRTIGLVSQINGQSKLDMWGTDKCNEIDGSDSSQFPPHLMEHKQDLDVFTQALCRKLPLRFEKEVEILGGIPVWRYTAPEDVLANPKVNPDNACFCAQADACLPSGIFNGTDCYGAPIYPSFPHFYTGDPVLYEQFEGIHSEAEKHQTFADIHPRLAFPLGGASRVQFNILLHKGTMMRNKLRRMEDGIFLPIMWLELSSGDVDDDLRTLIFHSTYSVNVLQSILKYGTLLTCVTSFALIVVSFYYLGKRREEGDLKAKQIENDRSEMETFNKIKIVCVAE